ncbi:MAG: hypothetical protein RMH75_07050 [Archaeoglobaceae archaeon]|nr:hypothetical protein [Archaeoglobaceae archaeon]MDW7990397.1 hypothetical protein [Archaeoglobaceae archaeon]
MGETLVKKEKKFKLSFFSSEFLEKLKDDLYSVDIFETEKFLKNSKILAFFLCVFFSGILFLQNLLLPASLKISNKILVFLAAITFLYYPFFVRLSSHLILALKKSEKNTEINKNFYTALSIFSGLARGGIPLGEAIKYIANSKLKGIREEFAKINIALFIHGLDIKTAILKVALTTPNEKLSYFLRGLANHIEEKREYASYVDNFLQLDNINRKIELATYSEKMKNIVAVFVTLITACVTIALIAIASVEGVNISIAIYSVYFGLPFSTFLTMLMMRVGNPIKEEKKEKGLDGFLIAISCTIVGLFAASLSFIGHEKFKIYAIALAISLSIFGYLYTFRARRKEVKITGELDSFLMKLRAFSELKSNILESIDKKTYIGRELGQLLTSSMVLPTGDALLKASDKVRHPFLSMVLYVLSAVIHKTRKISDVILALIYEYYRYSELLKLRKSIYSLTIIFAGISIVIMVICMGIMKYNFIPLFLKVSSIGGISFDARLARNLADDSIILVASTTPLALGAISGDFRKCYPLFFILLSIALIFILF